MSRCNQRQYRRGYLLGRVSTFRWVSTSDRLDNQRRGNLFRDRKHSTIHQSAASPQKNTVLHSKSALTKEKMNSTPTYISASEGTANVGAATWHWSKAADCGRNSATETDLSLDGLHRRATENEAAQLLLSMSHIVSNEIKSNAFVFQDDDESSKDDSRSGTDTEEKCLLTPRLNSPSPTLNEEREFRWNRLRSVSIDSPPSNALFLSPKLEPSTINLGRPALISPTSTPVGRGRPLRSASLKLSQKAKPEPLKLPKIPQMTLVTTTVKDHKKKALAASVAQGKKLMTIGRKKFSWKNYPGMSLRLLHVHSCSETLLLNIAFVLLLLLTSQNWKPFSLRTEKSTFAIRHSTILSNRSSITIA